MRSLEEKKEEVISHYVLSYDLEIAMLKAELTDDEMKLLKNDKSFMYRIDFQNALIRESIVKVMVNNVKSADERVAQKAAIDLGNLLYKEKFKAGPEQERGIVPDSIILKGKKSDYKPQLNEEGEVATGS